MDIDSIIDRLGLKPKNLQEGRQLKFSYVTNSDGTVRWFWPSNSKRPLFLKFYYVQGWKAKAFSTLTRLLFKLNLQRLLFRSVSTRIHFDKTSLLYSDSEWAVFTGTPGPNRKAIVYESNKTACSFIKVPIGEQAFHALRNEAAALHHLNQSNHEYYCVPADVNFVNNSIQVTDISGSGIRTYEFTDAHNRALLEIRNETLVPAVLKHLHIWKTTKERIDQLAARLDTRLPKGLIHKLKKLVATVDEDRVINVCLSHGDFTPWNMFLGKTGKLSMYDWELCQNEMPYGFDAFHFVIQNGILVKRNSWREIYETIDSSLFNHTSLLGTSSPEHQQFYLKLYLIINTTYYLCLYSKQSTWHQQVEWLLNTWNVALSDQLPIKMSNRMLVAQDVFDFLTNRNYALMKFQHEKLEDIDESSDLDICISKVDYQAVSNFLDKHALVKNRSAIQKSFMASEHLMLQDGSMLSFDFIWKFKRKQIQVMDVSSILKSTRINSEGVKIASPIDNARFIGWFYSLNEAGIPEKYIHYKEALRESVQEFDSLLELYFEGNVKPKTIKQVAATLSCNKGVAGLKNTISYFIDTLREQVSSKGMVITFSGVDGAGKSTVIENLKWKIEKQLRKRAIVIRHRPSVLPILSAWTKGKAQAEREAASTLPRQGSNKSSLSSFLRFAYYYTDYILGQWYVMLRYVLRGYVVLYDRYYFDFINDSKRSNIQLPESITRLGYALIREPDFNYFLFAKPEVILARKKELEKQTIEELTGKYLNLFQRLNKRKATARYIPIENVELGATLKQIMDQVTNRLAA